jgi:hypothetical protein
MELVCGRVEGHMQFRQRLMGVLEDILEHWISPMRVLEAA